MAKRVPPSQRPERQLDDQARAIARMLEDDKAKPAEEKAPSEPGMTRGFKGMSNIPPKKFVQPKGTAPGISTKRPKAPNV